MNSRFFKLFRVYSNRRKCQMEAYFPGVDSSGTELKFKYRKKNSCCLTLHLSCSFSFISSNVRRFFWHLILEKEKENRFCAFASSTKREIGKFHGVVVQRRQRNVQKSVMHVQSCCFGDKTLLLFCRSRCRRRLRCLSSPLGWQTMHKSLRPGLKTSVDFRGQD